MNGRGWAGAGPAHPRRRGPDRGGASLWVLSFGFVLLLAGGTSAAVGAATVARHRAQSAADLGALAGAAHAADGGAVACARSQDIAARNGARVVGCRLDGLDVVLTVEVELAAISGIAGVATARARAGPVRNEVVHQFG